MRRRNRLTVVEALRSAGAASRGDLVRATGLARSTVSHLVAELVAAGVVVESADRSGGGRGRPATLLRLAGPAGAALGLDFGHRHLRVAVADLSSRVAAERWHAVDVDHDAGDAIDAAASLVDDVLRQGGFSRDDVVGVAAGLPGPVDARTGRVGSSVILPGWRGLDPAAELSSHLGLPVRVDNDANLGARGEAAYGAGRGRSDIIYVKVSSGIGAGLFLGGRVHAGATGMAGELGHVQVAPDGAVCRCGNRGCLESVAAVPALLELLRPTHGRDLDVKGLVTLVQQGDPGARRVVDDAGRMLGRVLADLCNVLNPQTVIVGGDLGGAGEPLLTGIRDSLGRHALPAVAESLELVAGALGDRAEVLGALRLVITETERRRPRELAAVP